MNTQPKTKDYARCGNSPDGKHSVDLNSVHSEYSYGVTYIDVNCRYCGQSGTVAKIDENTEIDW